MQCYFRTTFLSTSFLCGINDQCPTISFVPSPSSPFLLVAAFLTTVNSLTVAVFDTPPSLHQSVRPSVRPSRRWSLAFVSRSLKSRS